MLEFFEKTVIKEVNELFDHLDEQALCQAKQLIITSERQGGRVHVTGIGKPSYVSGYIASLFSSTGTPAYFLDGTEAVHGSSGQVKLGDSVIAISNSGETAELLKTVRTLKNNGAKIIAVTGSLTSSLGKIADSQLCVHVAQEGDTLNKPPRVSIIKQVLLLQMLSLLLQEESQLTPETYVKWHPGGAIGQSLSTKQ